MSVVARIETVDGETIRLDESDDVRDPEGEPIAIANLPFAIYAKPWIVFATGFLPSRPEWEPPVPDSEATPARYYLFTRSVVGVALLDEPAESPDA